MVQKYTGRFFHIDFGHFLGHLKRFAGIILRDKEPFIYSTEMDYFIRNFRPNQEGEGVVTGFQDGNGGGDSNIN